MDEVMEPVAMPATEEVVPEVVERVAAPAPTAVASTAVAPTAVAPAPAVKAAAPAGKPEWKQAVRHPPS